MNASGVTCSCAMHVSEANQSCDMHASEANVQVTLHASGARRSIHKNAGAANHSCVKITGGANCLGAPVHIRLHALLFVCVGRCTYVSFFKCMCAHVHPMDVMHLNLCMYVYRCV